MGDPARVARAWLGLAVATLWTVTPGSQLEDGPTPEWPELPDLRSILGSAITGIRPRRARLFHLGWLWLIVQLMAGQPLPLARQLVPEPWPDPSDERWLPSPVPTMQKTCP